MQTSFSKSSIQKIWQPLNWQTLDAIDGEALRYAQYYGINFADRMPRLRHAFGYFDAANHRISVHAWMPDQPKGTVLVCHGYFDHVGLYRHVIEYLLDRNYAVLAYDLPGHGLSTGPIAAIDDFKIYQEVLKQCLENKSNHFPKPWHVVAQSTGGAIIMDFALSHIRPDDLFPFEQTILFAPLIRPARWKQGRILHSLISPFKDYVKRDFPENSNNPNFVNFIRNLDPLQSRGISAKWVSALKRWVPDFEKRARIHLSPIIIQGDQDETVDWRHNLNIIEDKFNNPDIYLLPGARHQLANESEDIRTKIRNILDQYLA